MPGVIGSGATPFFAAQLCGVSAKLKNSNSSEHIGWTPDFAARASTRFSTCRPSSGNGSSRPLTVRTKLPRKKSMPPSHGTLRWVERSRRASASG